MEDLIIHQPSVFDVPSTLQVNKYIVTMNVSMR